MNTLIDGKTATSIPADDRAVLFGESVFETIAFLGPCAALWDLHMARLARTVESLGWEMPEVSVLASECRQLVAASGSDRSIIRITITGGSGGQGYWPANEVRARRILQCRPWPGFFCDQIRFGLKTVISSFRLAPAGPFSGLKHGNRLLQTQAARECRRRGADEAILLDGQGQLVEALSSNLILVKGSRLLTPANPDVAGVGLAWLRDVLGLDLEVGSVNQSDIKTLSEVLMINSVAGIRPVVSVDDQPYPIGSLARRLQSIWHEKIDLCV